MLSADLERPFLWRNSVMCGAVAPLANGSVSPLAVPSRALANLEDLCFSVLEADAVMKTRSVLIGMGYGLGLLLVTLPPLEPVVTLLPAQPDDVRWRLRAFGAMSPALLLPTVGLMVAVGAAVLLEHRRTVRLLAAVALFGGLAVGTAGVLFTADLLQYRSAVDEQLQEFYRVAGVVYLVSYALCSVFLMALGAVAWRASRRSVVLVGHGSRRRRRSRRSRLPPAP